MATVQYDAKTGKKLATGATTTDALGNTYKQGSTYAPKTNMNLSETGGSSSVSPASPGYKYGKEGKVYATQEEADKAYGVPTGVPSTDMGNQKIDTTQPSPQNQQVGAQNIIKFNPNDGSTLAPNQSVSFGGQTYTQGQQFKQGFQDTVSKGIGAPATQGEANAITKQSILPQQEDTSVIDSFLEQDKGFQNIKDTYADYFSPENQKTSLMDTYNKLFKQAGLAQLDEEIIDAQTIIDGTEDDIRNEVEQAGGFATDSQVQAMSLSRNKVLLKNYNNLVAMRESKTNNLNTMIGLAEKDRAYADNQVDRMFNYETKMLDYRDKFIQNAKDQYNKYEPAQLQAMLADNPRQLAFAEAILGVGEGGIQKMVNAPLSLEDKYKQAQIDKIYADINDNGIKGMDASGVMAYAQQYASTGAIPTGLPKGTFGLVSQVAKELPKPNGEVVDINTNIKSGKVTPTQVDAYGALRDLTKKLEEAKALYQGTTRGLFGATIGGVFPSEKKQEYKILRDEMVDLLARARTGAAISSTEEALYKNKIPGYWNKTLWMGTSGKEKLDGLQKSLSDRLDTQMRANGVSMYGFSKVKVGDGEYTVGDVIQNEKGQQGRINADGSITLIQ